MLEETASLIRFLLVAIFALICFAFNPTEETGALLALSVVLFSYMDKKR
jgi:hypothetical protein